jgi:hypothetical protein
MRLNKRVVGIEPTTNAWEAFILPLNYTRKSGKPARAQPH